MRGQRHRGASTCLPESSITPFTGMPSGVPLCYSSCRTISHRLMVLQVTVRPASTMARYLSSDGHGNLGRERFSRLADKRHESRIQK